jgi:DNA-binding transcriptional LysR family regulator
VDRLEAMALLVAAVETGSFSAAGRKLGMPLPTVSRKVSELEAHLQTRLLLRSTRKLMLTDAGIAYLAACKRILDQVGDAERAASGEYSEPRGDLVVTAPIVFGRLHVLPVVTDFLAAFAEINVDLVLADRTLHFTDDHLDVSLRIGLLPDSNLVATRVGYVSRVVCGSPSLIARLGMPKKPADLIKFPWIGYEGAIAEVAAPSKPRLTVNTAEAAIDAAIAGVGLIHALSYQTARVIAEGKLKRVLEDFEPEPKPVSLMHAGQGLLPLKTRKFLEFAAPRLRDVLTRIAKSKG